MRVSLQATENAKPQYIKVRPSEDNPFLKFQTIDLRFYLTIAPALDAYLSEYTSVFDI